MCICVNITSVREYPTACYIPPNLFLALIQCPWYLTLRTSFPLTMPPSFLCPGCVRLVGQDQCLQQQHASGSRYM
ncbi:hypothetical protein DPMN_169604 [Dreissena polymorpha]|uniref:Uncharacterized protein n=1 Tax=Dreissena polymorpha TaxID=45954 RepID=A0A9D4DY80_DREPO|nr:hypothetical protein DPMN_169604 [Dreissena polymorpha]